MEHHYQLSYWEKNTFFSNIDTIVIGSGIVGLNAAITLKSKQPWAKIVVLERGTLPIGASTRNAGFACFGSISELLADLENNHSESEVWSLVERRWKGLQRLRSLIGADVMDYQENGGYELFLEGDENIFDQCKDSIPKFNRILSEITGETEIFSVRNESIETFGFKNVKNIILNKAEGQIDTGKMMQALLALAQEKGIEILNGITVRELEYDQDRVEVVTEKGWRLQGDRLLVATNGFAKMLLPNLMVKPARNQVMITPPIPNLKVKGCFHYNQGYYYFRNIHNRILLGGGRNLNLEEEATNEFGTTLQIQENLKTMLDRIILPDQQVSAEHWWSGILGVGEHKKPIVQKLNPNVVVAVRLGGMGVAIGSLIGEEAADLLEQ